MQHDQGLIARLTSTPFSADTDGEIVRRMMAPVTTTLVEEARIVSGHSVLDVATGTGEPALSIARIVGPNGSVVGVDPLATSIAEAAHNAERFQLSNIHFDVATADSLPFADAHFDAVVSRFGIMFFPSTVRAVRELLRVTKSGGRLAFAVWGFIERNPFHSILARAIDRYFPPETPKPDAPGPFRFASSGSLLKALDEAGVSNPTERLFQFTIDAALSVEAYWGLRLRWADKLRQKATSLAPDAQAAITREVFDAHQPYVIPNGLRIPAEVLIVSGSKP